MGTSLHARLLNRLGRSIVTGEYPPAAVLLTDDVVKSFEVSRSVAREAVRVLESLGMVSTVKRIGIRVLPMESWNVFDPHVIRWRLESNARGEQLRSLSELRAAIEPYAAQLAAEHGPESLAVELLETAAQMRHVGRDGNLDEFFRLDSKFHSLLLTASGNEMLAQLDNVVREVLAGRTQLGLMPSRPHEEALQWHVDLANAVQVRQPDLAREAANNIMQRTMKEIHSQWSEVPRVFLSR